MLSSVRARPNCVAPGFFFTSEAVARKTLARSLTAKRSGTEIRISRMSRQGWLPALFGRVWRRTQTPVAATIAAAGTVLVLALWLPLVTLAKSTSFLVLLIFSLMNLSLLRIKRRDPHPEGLRVMPQWIPASGIVASLGLLLFQVFAG